MPRTHKESLSFILAEYHKINVEATLAKLKLPDTLATLQSLTARAEERDPELVYKEVTFRDLARLYHSEQPSTLAPLKSKLGKRCSEKLAKTEWGKKVSSDPSLRISSKSSAMPVYECFRAVVKVLTQLGVNQASEFTVLDFVQNKLTESDGYTADVWTAIDACLADLVSDTLYVAGNTKATVKNLRQRAQFDNRVHLYGLLNELYDTARQSRDTALWMRVSEFCSALKMTPDEVLMQEAIATLPNEEWLDLEERVERGKAVTWNLLQSIMDRQQSRHGSQRKARKATNALSATKLEAVKAEVKALKEKNRRLQTRLDRIDMPSAHILQHDANTCSVGLCDWNHGTDACPFEGNICKVCMEPFTADHPVYGRCNKVKKEVKECIMNGKEVNRIQPIANGSNSGKGQKGKLSRVTVVNRRVTKTIGTCQNNKYKQSSTFPSAPRVQSIRKPRNLPHPTVVTSAPKRLIRVQTPVAPNQVVVSTSVKRKPAIVQTPLRPRPLGVAPTTSKDASDNILAQASVPPVVCRVNSVLPKTRQCVNDSLDMEDREKPSVKKRSVTWDIPNESSRVEESELDIAKRELDGCCRDSDAGHHVDESELNHNVDESELDSAKHEQEGCSGHHVDESELDHNVEETKLDSAKHEEDGCSGYHVDESELDHNVEESELDSAKHEQDGCCRDPDATHHDSEHHDNECLSLPEYPSLRAADVALVQTPNAHANMWNVTRPIDTSQCHGLKQEKPDIRPTNRGRIKFYTNSRGKGTSSAGSVPWGFIEPLDKTKADVHFTLFALENIPESIVRRNVVVDYSVMPGTNSAAAVNMVTLDGKQTLDGEATIDSGAYMCVSDKAGQMINYRKLSHPIPVGTARSGEVLMLVGIGDLLIRENGQLRIFRNVFHAPGCATTLLSVRMLTKFGGWTLYADDKVTKLTHRDSKEVIYLDFSFRFPYSYEKRTHQGRTSTTKKPVSREELAAIPGFEWVKRHGPPIQLINTLNAHQSDLKDLHRPHDPRVATIREDGAMEFMPMSEMGQDSYCNWHRRLGHQSQNYVKKFAATHGITFTDNIPDGVCETCALSKMTRHFSTNKRPRASKFLDRIHADTIGPFKPIGREGSRYALIVVDCCSRAPHVYSQSSNDATTTMKSLDRFCTDTGGKPKEVQADGGSEFKGICQRWCDSHGIQMRLSPPYAHYLNGVVERKIRSLKEMTRCLLNDSQLPHTFWPYALKYAAHIIYRSGTTALPGWKSPYEVIHGMLPKPEHLKVFGSKLIFHQGSDRRANQSKSSKALRNTGREGVFLGIDERFPSGTYTIYDTETHKVVHSNNVVFMESENITNTQAWEYFSHPDVEDEEFYADPDYVPEEDLDTYDSNDDADDGEDEENIADPTNSETEDTSHIEEPTDDGVSGTRLPATHTSKSRRTRRRPDRYDPHVEAQRPQLMRRKVLHAVQHLYLLDGTLRDSDIKPTLPKSDRAAMNDPHFGKQWREAKAKELAQFERFKVFTEVDRNDVPLGAQIIPTHFIRSIKTSGRLKYRLVASGNLQLGTTAYAPTAALTSLRMVAAQCTQQGYPLRQADVSAAFLQSPIEDEVYVERPPRYDVDNREYRRKVWKLNKAMYGLRKSPRYWYQTVSKAMQEFGLTPSPSDPCVYHKEGLLVGIWVDDFLYGGTKGNIVEFEQFLFDRFQCDTPEDAHLFCGITITQELHDGKRRVTLEQTRFIEQLMSDYAVTPAAVESPIQDYLEFSHGQEIDKKVPFRQLLGSLMYVMIATRPDLAFAIHHFSRHAQSYTKDHFAKLCRILQYAHHTQDKQLVYEQNGGCTLSAYSDANWAGCPETRQSTSGRIIFYGKSPVSWCSQLQRAISTSSFESELYALTDAVKEVVYLRIFLENIGVPQQRPSTIYCDNKATVQVCSGFDTNLKKLRHLRDLKRFLDIRRRFILTQKEDVQIIHCTADKMLADLLTKPLGPKKTSKCVQRILQTDRTGMVSSTYSSVGGY